MNIAIKKGCKHQFVWRVCPVLPRATPENNGTVFKSEDLRFHELSAEQQQVVIGSGYILPCDDKCQDCVDKSLT